nr:MAG TPA: hypothetical protein [Caudoviricetes sp.]
MIVWYINIKVNYIQLQTSSLIRLIINLVIKYLIYLTLWECL